MSGQNIPGHLLHSNNIDTTTKVLLFSINASSCKNSVYLNNMMFLDAKSAGYAPYFCINGLANEDLEAFKEENEFANSYPILLDKQLNAALQNNAVYLLQGTKIVIATHCMYTAPIYKQLQTEKNTAAKTVDSVSDDTSYKFYSGAGAYLNEEYCLVMDFRFSRKLHKINMQTGKIAQQFTFDEKVWAEKIYNILYQGDKSRVAKSVKARQLFLKKDRIFNDQEFEPENITVNGNRIIVSVRFNFPYIDNEEDTFSKETKVLFQLDDSLQITDYWVVPLKHLEGDFYIPSNSDMTPLLVEGDTVYLPVMYIYYQQKQPPAKYVYAKCILTKTHSVAYHSYLPFVEPDEKTSTIGDYRASHMYLLKLKDQIIGSYILYPSIYNLHTNSKIYDIELVGKPKQRKNKLDSLIFAKDLNNLTFVITYFSRYKDKYYLMQVKNGTWNSFILFDKDLQHIKTSYFSPITKDEGRAFYSKDDTLYLLKFGVKSESDMYIVKRSIKNIFGDINID